MFSSRFIRRELCSLFLVFKEMLDMMPRTKWMRWGLFTWRTCKYIHSGIVHIYITIMHHHHRHHSTTFHSVKILNIQLIRTEETTHLICDLKGNTPKKTELKNIAGDRGKVVTMEWVNRSYVRRVRMNEDDFAPGAKLVDDDGSKKTNTTGTATKRKTSDDDSTKKTNTTIKKPKVASDVGMSWLISSWFRMCIDFF